MIDDLMENIASSVNCEIGNQISKQVIVSESQRGQDMMKVHYTFNLIYEVFSLLYSILMIRQIEGKIELLFRL